MSACTRFPGEGLVAWEQGRPPDAHVLACPDCGAQRRALERLAPVLRAGPPDLAPPAGWQQRVLAAADATPGRARPRRARGPLLWAIPLFAAAAAILLFLRPQGDLPAPALDWTIVPADGRRLRGGAPGEDGRNETASAGDHLKVWGPIPAGARFELRVFRGSELVFRCPPGCGAREGRLEVDVPLGVAGRYDAFVAVARGQLPDPGGGGRAADLARVVAAGGRVFELPALTVR